jgi:hypothetical protein
MDGSGEGVPGDPRSFARPERILLAAGLFPGRLDRND